MNFASPGRGAVLPAFAAAAVGLGVAVGGGLLAPATAQAGSDYDMVWSVDDGTVVSWAVPDGVCGITWDLIGGAGGSYHYSGEGSDGVIWGGHGGQVQASTAVTPGQTFTLQVGGQGGDLGDGRGGLSGSSVTGGASGGSGGGGGGASIVRNGGAGGDLLLVAGGGGGIAGSYGLTGGDAGEFGSAGQDNTYDGITAGRGGTTSAGGAPGDPGSMSYPQAGQPGAPLAGGAGAAGAGGGGAGYYGGGGGAGNKFRSFYDPSGAGGGGGANFAAGSVTVATNSTAGNRGDGLIGAVFSPCPVSAPVPVLDTATSPAVGVVDLGFHFVDDADDVTGYQYSVDGGDNWIDLQAEQADDGSWTASLGGYSAGQYLKFVVRALVGDVAGEPSNIVDVTVASPAAVAPGAPRAVTAVSDHAQVEVTWQAPTSGAAVDHYLVTLSPGGQSVETTDLSVLFGAESGVTYTATVVAVSADDVAGPGTSGKTADAAAAPLVPATVPEDAELTLTTDHGLITTATPGQDITVIGTGFLPFSTATIVIYSDPIVLGTVVTDADGDFSKPVTVPAGLEAGHHSLIASGVAPDGSDRFLRMNVTVAADDVAADDDTAGTETTTDSSDAGAASDSDSDSDSDAREDTTDSLAYTGFEPVVPLALGLGAVLVGGVTLLLVRRRRSA